MIARRLAFGLVFYASMGALLVYGGEIIAGTITSAWVAAIGGLVVAILFFSAFWWAERVLFPAGDVHMVSGDPDAQEEDQRLGTSEIIVVLALGLIMLAAASGYSGTSPAFGGGALMGYLIALVAFERRNEKSSLQS